MISSSYGSSKTIKWRLGRTRQGVGEWPLFHLTSSYLDPAQKSPENSVIFKTLSFFIYKVRIRQWWTLLIGPGRWHLKVSLCPSHHGEKAEIVFVVLKKTFLINHPSQTIVMTYKDWPRKLNCRVLQFRLQQALEVNGHLLSLSNQLSHCFDFLSLMRGLYKKKL